MRCVIAALFALLPALVNACDRPVCVVDPVTLDLARIITFDDQPGNLGPGRLIGAPLILPGASFGDGFAGQVRAVSGTFDAISGPASAPLTLFNTPAKEMLSVTRLASTNVLNGLGPLGYPQFGATGEGAIAILFDRDQAAIRLDLRGGEGGTASVIVLNRDGQVIGVVTLGPLAEAGYGLIRQDKARDIAAVVINNDDPEGIALQAVAFDGDDRIG